MYDCAVLDDSFAAAGCHAASPREDFEYQGRHFKWDSVGKVNNIYI